jgi:hypothetical protein
MLRRALRCLVAPAALFTLLTGHAQAPASCELPASDRNPLADRAGILSEYQRLPHACLQQIVRACSDASSRMLMDFGSAAACSFGYEALLAQQFGGDFPALLAWWRSQSRDDVQ